MWRYFVGVLAGVLLVAGGVFLWQNTATAKQKHGLLPLSLASSTAAPDPQEDAIPEPPAASQKTREEKRFSRYDHDKNGRVSRDEFLAARKRAFAKLDTNGDGQLSFDEYAVKGVKRFGDADTDHDQSLTAAEFATTRVQRKAKAATRCPPAQARGEEEADSDHS